VRVKQAKVSSSTNHNNLQRRLEVSECFWSQHALRIMSSPTYHDLMSSDYIKSPFLSNNNFIDTMASENEMSGNPLNDSNFE
jgi:hypothetical protein